jgi:DnaK suppressor protein
LTNVKTARGIDAGAGASGCPSRRSSRSGLILVNSRGARWTTLNTQRAGRVSGTGLERRIAEMTGLTTQQTRQLERHLQARRSSVLTEAHEELTQAAEQSYAEIAGEVPDFGDQATAASLTDYSNVIARRHVEAIREIEDALVRIRERGFGHCIECGAAIRFERLKAFPTARRCVSCQSMHERTFAVGATPSL